MFPKKKYPYMRDHDFFFVTETYPIDTLHYWIVWIGWTCFELHVIEGVGWRLLHAPPYASPTCLWGDVQRMRSRILRKVVLHQKQHPVGENCYAPAGSRRINLQPTQIGLGKGGWGWLLPVKEVVATNPFISDRGSFPKRISNLPCRHHKTWSGLIQPRFFLWKRV